MVGLNLSSTDKVYAPFFNNMANANRIGVLGNCEVTASTPNAMTVDVASGTIFNGSDTFTVSAAADEAITAAPASNTRLDLVVVNNTGTVSVLDGTAAIIPVPPTYDADTYIPLAIVTVAAGTTAITTNMIKDCRVLNQGGAGSASGTFAKHIEPFVSQTSVTVQHNLGDSTPNVFVYDSSNELIEPQQVTIVNSNSLTVTLTSSTTGTVVVYGGSGQNNGYYSTTLSGSSPWTVTHNLQQEYVNITIYDDSDVVYDYTGDTITIVGENSFTIASASDLSDYTVVVTGGTSSYAKPTYYSQKSDEDTANINVFHFSKSDTTSLSNTSSILFVNEGLNDCYIDLDGTATTSSFKLFSKSKLLLEDVNFTTVSAICDSGETTTLKIMYFTDLVVGSYDSKQINAFSVTDTSANQTLDGSDSNKKIILLNSGANNIYYKFDTTATTNDMVLFPNDFIELDNIQLENLAYICDSSKTSTLHLLNLY